MKTLIIAFALSLASTAFAGVFKDSYKENTLVPESLQDEVAQTVLKRFPCLSNLKEIHTTERTVKIDQGMVDHFYTTVFTAFTNLDHPNSVYVTVDSAEYAVQNGKNTDVLGLQTNYGEYLCQ
jgi:hypothetical protein